jgi:ligand-binding sensor domain-containing protein
MTRLFIFVFLFLQLNLAAQNNCWTAFLHENNIRSLTERGTSIWVGTDFGIVEIDRASHTILQRFDRSNSPIDGPVTALSVGSDGTLLVGTNTFWRTDLTNFWKKELVTSSEIHDIYQKDSIVWVATQLGLYRIGVTVQPEFFQKTNSQLPVNWVNTVRTDDFGNVWLGVGQPFSAGGLVKIPANGASWKYFKKSNAPLPQTSAVRDLTIDQKGAVWMVAENEVLRLDTAGIWTNFDPTPNGGDYNACSIGQKTTGEIVVGMENSLATLGANGQFLSQPTNDFFKDNTFIFNLLCASDGSIWAGSNVNGLSVATTNLVEKIDISASPMPLSPVTAMAIDPAGDIWAGTAFGGFAKFSNNTWTFFPNLLKEQPSIQILDIQFDTDGLPVVLLNNLWQKWSLLKFDGTNFTEWTSGYSGFNGKRRVRRVADAWYVNSTRGLFRWQNGTLTQFDTATSNIPTNFIYDMDNDPQGNLWLTTVSKGLVFFDGNDFGRIDSTTNGLPTDSLLAITIGKDGYPFFGDAKGRLVHYGLNGVEIWKDTTPVADNRITILELDPKNGALWLNNKSGGTRFTTENGGKWVPFSTQNPPFAVGEGPIRSILPTQNDVWFGMNRGAYQYDQNCLPSVSTDDSFVNLRDLFVYPNPTTEIATFDFILKNKADLTVKLVDLMGKMVVSSLKCAFAAGENRVEISVFELPNGVYFYEILDKNLRVSVGKLIKI